jgi:hypothetical protein
MENKTFRRLEKLLLQGKVTWERWREARRSLEEPYKIAFPAKMETFSSRKWEREPGENGNLFPAKSERESGERESSWKMETFSCENRGFSRWVREGGTDFSEDSRMNLVFCFILKDSRERERKKV